MADKRKCSCCGTDEARVYRNVDLLGFRFVLCDECFSVAWALMGQLGSIGNEIRRRRNLQDSRGQGVA